MPRTQSSLKEHVLLPTGGDFLLCVVVLVGWSFVVVWSPADVAVLTFAQPGAAQDAMKRDFFVSYDVSSRSVLH